MDSIVKINTYIGFVVFVTALTAGGMEEEGSCLLSQRSWLNRIATFSQQAEEHHAWRSKHFRLLKVVNQSTDRLSNFIKAQNSSEDACSARLLQEKRALDGLLTDLKTLSAQVSSHEEVLETETENLRITNMSIVSVEQMYADMIAKCKKEHEEALRELAQYTAELKELDQIAKPAVRYSHTIQGNDVPSVSLLGNSAAWWGESTCTAFLHFMKQHFGLWIDEILQHNRSSLPATRKVNVNTSNRFHVSDPSKKSSTSFLVGLRENKDIKTSVRSDPITAKVRTTVGITATKIDTRNCKGRDFALQKRYRAWCDQAVGLLVQEDGTKVRSQFCRGSPTRGKILERCRSSEDFSYCFMAYYGCTAQRSDTQRCCTDNITITEGVMTSTTIDAQGVSTSSTTKTTTEATTQTTTETIATIETTTLEIAATVKTTTISDTSFSSSTTAAPTAADTSSTITTAPTSPTNSTFTTTITTTTTPPPIVVNTSDINSSVGYELTTTEAPSSTDTTSAEAPSSTDTTSAEAPSSTDTTSAEAPKNPDTTSTESSSNPDTTSTGAPSSPATTPAPSLSCGQQRQELQKVYTKAYNNVRELLKDAAERTKDKTCNETAEAYKTAEMVPLVAQRDQAAGRIEYSTQALAALQPVLNLVKDQAEKIRVRIKEVLTPECQEASAVSRHLEKVRELIVSLEECPGRQQFNLKIPSL